MPTSTDIEMLRIVVCAFASVLIVALIAFAIIGRTAFSKVERGAGKSFGFMFSRGNFLRISTVVFCIFAVVVLAITGKLSDGAIAVLSGIAGFVLGGTSTNSRPSFRTKSGTIGGST
ncbi:MAG: hypothetical protein LBE50_02935 [Gallionellaceae bacterium]|jgi:hypothetical protein|nr:hypothetical protein [Gallionellaceae bacterium]